MVYTALVAAFALAQTVTPVKIINPENQSQGLGNANPLKVNCVSGCSGSSSGGGGDGGYTIVIQGPGADGGVDWGVTVTGTVGVSGSVTVVGPLTDTQLRASAVPISGTVTANAGSGTLAVSAAALPLPSGASTSALQTTGNTSLANLDVALSTRTKPADQQHTIVDSSALPSGASTLAKQPALGAAGTASTDVITVQGIAAMTALKVDGSGVTQPVSGTVTATGPLTDTQLRATAVPISGTVTTTPPSNASTNVAQVNGITTQTGTGTAGTGTQRVAVASDSSITANAGTNLNTSALALSATQTDRTQKAQVTDGTRDGTVKAASTAAIATDTALVVAVSPNNSVAITAASLPLPTGAATSANQTTLGNQTTKLNDGVDTALVSGSGSLQVTCDNCGGSTFADNGAFTANTTPVVNIGGVFDDASPNAVTEDHAAAPRISSRREMYNQLRDAAGNERGANVNASNALLTAQTGALPAGTNVIGHVISDTGSTTAVTGNVTVVQPTGTNLHAVLDTTSTTAVTQATGTNLHVVTDATSVLAANQSVNVNQWGGSGTTLGSKTSANSVPVVIASDQAAVSVAVQSFAASLPVSATGGTINRDGLGVSVTTSSSTCLGADVSRQGCVVCLAIDATDYVSVRYSATAATGSYQKLAPGQCAYCTFGNRVYQDAITCIAASGTQTVYAADID